jgi:hypothetical protein
MSLLSGQDLAWKDPLGWPWFGTLRPKPELSMRTSQVILTQHECGKAAKKGIRIDNRLAHLRITWIFETEVGGIRYIRLLGQMLT